MHDWMFVSRPFPSFLPFSSIYLCIIFFLCFLLSVCHLFSFSLHMLICLSYICTLACPFHSLSNIVFCPFLFLNILSLFCHLIASFLLFCLPSHHIVNLVSSILYKHIIYSFLYQSTITPIYLSRTIKSSLETCVTSVKAFSK